MVRRIERLTLDHLPALALPACAACVHWQLDAVRRTRPDVVPSVEKAAWVSTLLRDWGQCGAVVTIDGEPVAHAMWGPASHLLGLASYPTTPVSPDAVVLTNIFVHPEHRNAGLGRQLVRAMAKEMIKRKDVRAIESIAFSPTAANKASRCVIPQDFLLAVGFSTHRPHSCYPRMRMDLRTTLSLREELEQVLDRILRPLPKPSPESGSGARVSLRGLSHQSLGHRSSGHQAPPERETP